MSTLATPWQYLEPRPKSAYRQLFVRGTRIRAEVVYGMHMSEAEPMSPEVIAQEYNLPVAAVREAIAYCELKPPEIDEDWRREEALMEATGMNDPNYKLRPTPKVIPADERARILGS